MLSNSIHVGARLLQSRGGLESAKHRKVSVRSIGAPGLFHWINYPRHPELSVSGELESGRHHANHGKALAVQLNCFVDDRRITSKLSSPKFIAEHRNSAGFLVFERKTSAKFGSNSQCRYQVGSDAGGGNALRLTTSS